jgi:aminoglycoside 6'-N-acetyltransferase
MIGDAGPHSFDFRPVVRQDLPLLAKWHAADHVSAWWGKPADLEVEYLANDAATRQFVVHLSGYAIGMMQLYPLADTPDYARLVRAEPGEVGIDYLIGEPASIGHGVGPAMIEAFLKKFVFGRDDVTGVRVDVAEGNRRSWRTLEKLGFVRTLAGLSVPEEPGPHYVYVLANQR